MRNVTKPRSRFPRLLSWQLESKMATQSQMATGELMLLLLLLLLLRYLGLCCEATYWRAIKLNLVPGSQGLSVLCSFGFVISV